MRVLHAGQHAPMPARSRGVGRHAGLAAHPLHACQSRAQARGTERGRCGHRRQLGHRRRSESARAGAGGHRRPADSQSSRRRRHPERRRQPRRGRWPSPTRSTSASSSPTRARATSSTSRARRRCAWPLVVVGDGRLRGSLEARPAQPAVDLRVQGWLPRDQVLGWMRHAVAARVSVARPRIAQPRPAGSGGPGRAHRGDGLPAARATSWSTSRRACCLTAPRASPATSRASCPTASSPRAWATPPAGTSSAPSMRRR